MKKTLMFVILFAIATLFALSPLISSATSKEKTKNIKVEVNGEEKQIKINQIVYKQLLDEISHKTDLSLEEIKENIEFEIEDIKEKGGGDK